MKKEQESGEQTKGQQKKRQKEMNLKWSPSDFYLFFATGLVAVYSGICVEVVTNSWHVGLTENAGPDVAKLVAKRNGFAYVMPVSCSINLLCINLHGRSHIAVFIQIPLTAFTVIRYWIDSSILSGFVSGGYF